MEKDNEIKGSGNSCNYGFRMYDSRLGRWLSLDPIMFPWQSSYISMNDNPIIFNDQFGDRVRFKDRETRKLIRKARKEDASFNQIIKDWRKEKGHTYFFKQSKGQNNGLYAAVRDVQQNGKHTLKSTDVLFDLMQNDNQLPFVGTKNQEISKVNLLSTPDISPPTIDLTINTQIRVGIPELVIPKPPSPKQDVVVNTPFISNSDKFENSGLAGKEINKAVKAFLNNPNAKSISIEIHTNLTNLQSFTNGTKTVQQLLIERAKTIRNILIKNLGVPADVVDKTFTPVLNKTPKVVLKVR